MALCTPKLENEDLGTQECKHWLVPLVFTPSDTSAGLGFLVSSTLNFARIESLVLGEIAWSCDSTWSLGLFMPMDYRQRTDFPCWHETDREAPETWGCCYTTRGRKGWVRTSGDSQGALGVSITTDHREQAIAGHQSTQPQTPQDEIQVTYWPSSPRSAGWGRGKSTMGSGGERWWLSIVASEAAAARGADCPLQGQLFS